MFIQGEHHISVAIDPSPAKAWQHSPDSMVSSLGPAKAQQQLRLMMEEVIQDARYGPSFSNDNLLYRLEVLRERDYQNAPGSKVMLSFKCGLLGGSGRSDGAGSSSSAAGASSSSAYMVEKIETSRGDVWIMHSCYGYIVDSPKKSGPGGITFGPFPTKEQAVAKVEAYLGLPRTFVRPD